MPLKHAVACDSEVNLLVNLAAEQLRNHVEDSLRGGLLGRRPLDAGFRYAEAAKTRCP